VEKEIQDLENDTMRILKKHINVSENVLRYEIGRLIDGTFSEHDYIEDENQDEEFERKFYEKYEDDMYDTVMKIDEHLISNPESKVMMYDPYHGIVYESIDSILKTNTILQMCSINNEGYVDPECCHDEESISFFEELLEKVTTIYPEKKDVIDRVQSIVNSYYEPEDQ
jgi:hypothetical protein